MMLHHPGKIFMLLAALISIAAGYHFLGMFYDLDQLPLWRHITFLIVDLFCVYGLIKRPGYFILFFILFTIQQFFSHGLYLIERLQDHHAIHWNSVFVLVTLPVTLMFLITDYIHKLDDSFSYRLPEDSL